MSYEPSGGDSVAAPESHTSRTGLSTDSPTFFSDCPAFRAGTTVRLSYCTHVLRRLRPKKHGTPATSVAGVYSFMGLERRRIGIGQNQFPRSIRERIFIPVGAV